jgi:hypothetical protein
MYSVIDKELDQPTVLNSKIVDYYKAIQDKMDSYSSDAINGSVFGQDVQGVYNKGNDFHYLLTLLVIIYYDEEMYYNSNGIYRTQEEKYEEYGLDQKRLYFNKYHQFDIVPLYKIFDIIDNTTGCTSNTILGPDTDVDLDCLIN